MTESELEKRLREHVQWMRGERGVRANLREADLHGANFSGADLRGANLNGANLREARLNGANLTGADLNGANLRGANFSGANLREADLRGANLARATLREANLTGANLYGADLYGADLYGADLADAILPHFAVCPEEGAFTAYKIVRRGTVLQLEIPANARRTSSLVGRKCRAERAMVVRALDGSKGPWISAHDESFRYFAGTMAVADGFSDDIRIECAKGIHFFMTRREAEEYA